MTHVEPDLKVDVTIGESCDAKCYTVHFSQTGEPVKVEVSFYGYKGRLTYRPVKKDGVAWKRAVRVAGMTWKPM